MADVDQILAGAVLARDTRNVDCLGNCRGSIRLQEGQDQLKKLDDFKDVSLNEIQEMVHNTAVEKGWWDTPPEQARNVPEMLMLIVSELAEALEDYRVNPDIDSGDNYIRLYDDKPEGFWVELGDAVIRIMDLAERYGVSLTEVIVLKDDYNRKRPYKHGGKAA